MPVDLMSVHRESAWLLLQHPIVPVLPDGLGAPGALLMLPTHPAALGLTCMPHRAGYQKGMGVCEERHWSVHHLPVQAQVAT